MKTVYIIDDGYGGRDKTVLGDLTTNKKSHGTMMCDVVRIFNPRANIVSVQIKDNDIVYVIQTILQLIKKVKPGDIVLFGWITNRNQALDFAVGRLVKKVTVIVPAGNYNKPVVAYSPTAVPGAHVISSINHLNERMSMSNYGSDTIPMYGVPIYHLGLTERGTSLAAAIYAGLYSRNSSEKFMRRATKAVYNIFHRGES